MCKKYWQRISEIIYCNDDFVLYVKTSANSLHCMHEKYIFSSIFQNMGIILGQMSYFTALGLCTRCQLIKLTLRAPDIYTTGAPKAPAVCFGTPCVPSSGSKLDVLETVYNFCLLGDYYLNIVCTVQVVEVSL